MNKIYIRLFIILVIAMIVCLLFYFLIDEPDLKSLIGNIFCGFYTGIIITGVSNIKEVFLYKNSNQITCLTEINTSISQILKKMCEYSEKESINILEFADILDDIDINFKRIAKVKYCELDKYIAANNIDLTIGEKVEEEILSPLENTLFISKNEFLKYRKKIYDLIFIQIKIRHVLKNKLDMLNKENDKLKKFAF